MAENIFEFADSAPQLGNAVIKVVGVGGGGGNAVEHMVNSGVDGVDFICVNTDRQALDKMHAPTRVQIGQNLTRGLGAGANPEVGRQAAVEDREQIRELLEGADMVFVTAGMGGGTGTGAAPVVAEVAKEMNILTVGVVTTPFTFEGPKRLKLSETGIDNLSQHVDSLITIPNAKLQSVLGNVALIDAFKAANNVLQGAVQGIADMIQHPGMINVDFADVRTVMSERGLALMGTGSAKGEDRARIATEMAIHSPLLDDIKLDGVRGLLVSIAADESLGLQEFATVGEIVSKFASSEATVVIGTILDHGLKDEIRVTVVATGLARAKAAAVTLVGGTATGIRQPQQLAATGTGGSAYGASLDLDKPAYERRNEASGASGAAARSNLMDIPAFLRNQAD